MKPVFDKVVGGNKQGDADLLQGMGFKGEVITHSGNMGVPEPLTLQQPSVGLPSSDVAQTDSKYIDLTDVLPSGMSYYGFDTLAIRPFGAQEIQKMHRAIVEQSVRHQIDAISACLDHSAYDLTLGDYQYLKYWARINSYKRHPVTVNWTCHHHEHLTKVGNNLLDASTLQQSHKVVKDNLVEHRLDFEKSDQFMRNFYDTYGLYLWTPMVSDLIEGIQEDIDADTDWWNKYAGMLNPQHHGKTLEDRRKFLQAHPAAADADMLMDMEDWAAVCQHGVTEHVEVTCTVCGDTSRQILRIDPMSFLPSSK